MRILMASQFFLPIPGGEERLVADLSVALAARGHDVAVVTTTPPPDPALVPGVRVIQVPSLTARLPGVHAEGERPHLPPFPDPHVVRALRRVLGSERPDVVHAHNWIVHSVAPAMARRGSAPLVLSLHDYSLRCATKRLVRHGRPCEGPRIDRCLACAARHYGTAKGLAVAAAMRPSTAFVLRAADLCLPVSTAVSHALRLEELPVDSVVVPDFIPDSLLAAPVPAPDPPPGLPPGPFIAFAGDLSHDKGVTVLLDAVARMDDAPPLVLVGRPLPDSPVRARPGVVVLGPRPHAQVMEVFRRSAVAVVPSVWDEPFGLVALEAMAAGRPVVASAAGGLRDIVVHEHSGLLVRPSDPDALAASLSRLMASPDLRRRLGEGAVARARELSASAVVPMFEAAYARARANRTRRAPARAARG